MRDPLDRMAWRLENFHREEQSHPGDKGAWRRRMRALAPVDERLAVNAECEGHLLDLMTLARKTRAIRHYTVKRLRELRRQSAQHVRPGAGLDPATELGSEQCRPIINVAEYQFMHASTSELTEVLCVRHANAAVTQKRDGRELRHQRRENRSDRVVLGIARLGEYREDSYAYLAKRRRELLHGVDVTDSRRSKRGFDSRRRHTLPNEHDDNRQRRGGALLLV